MELNKKYRYKFPWYYKLYCKCNNNINFYGILIKFN